MSRKNFISQRDQPDEQIKRMRDFTHFVESSGDWGYWHE